MINQYTVTYAKPWNYEEGESFPYLPFNCDSENCLYHPCDETLYEFWQPDSIENDEFCLIILLNGFPVKVISIDFDFVTKKYDF